MKKQSYDLVGDIHGQAPELERLLEKLSYTKVAGVWKHTERKMIFLGDFVDRGDYQKEVINIVRPMIENGYALSVMGNHEYNAIAYYTKDKDGNYLRSHNDKHTNQHKAFLSAYDSDLKEKKSVIEWFKTLPLWLDLDGLRIVHACWDFDLINRIDKPILTEDLLQQSSITGTWQNDAIETILKGKEIPLPEGYSFNDKDGNPRTHIRIKYWLKDAVTYQDYFMGPKNVLEDIPDIPVVGDYLLEYDSRDKPVFLGHYWKDGEIKSLTDNIACLDFSVARPGGKLVAYRWDDEQKIDQDKFVFVDRES
ncbi:metallophosphoesterase [Candidatus Woesearchaeota archaeon]|jgi:hypothetical protein|nr:metallophosphoesterase [Candidatus Woesearchaeota archaeon]MBT4764521.1 metallophosphoesterase [bacterium]MBT7557668.1 metallophosphoesterase [Candidatus Woesearchaeota archaeon]